MEVATTNNHSQSHHHHHHLQAAAAAAAQSHGNGGLVGAGGTGSRSPFQREVREWQRIDPNTGALFSGRLEADRWINGPLNSYGKISDSQNISQPNGTQHTQRKQLEVLKARTANGALQVIRTQTVQKTSSTTSSSTSRGWAASSTSTTTRTSVPTPPSIWSPPASRCRPKPMARPRPTSQSVDICELSDDDSSLSGSLSSDIGIVSPAMSTLRKLSNGQEHIDDHVDFVVINGEGSDQDADVAHLHKLGHNLLPDTAPSLKLSNLMKSSSSISSQSSNNSNLTTAAATATATAGNTHRSAGKISLHAIVGPESSSSSTSTSTSSAWAKQQQQQADLYGQPPAASNGSSSSSSRVGVSQAQPQPQSQLGTGSDADVAVVVAVVVAVAGGGGGGGSTPTRLRRDLESFRHYNDDAANDDDLRLSARHQRRQQVSQSVYAPPLPAIGSGLLQRSRSISTDDLSQDWERNEEQEEEPGEWRRVSKLRRSFQSQDHYKTNVTRPRPLDLPSNSVSVARMRAELENGRRLHTAMRNNHVDLAALDTILNTPTAKPTVAKRNTFLTAESLQEIRGKLKKLSDESLYKEDFLAYHQARPKLREQSEEQVQVPVQVAAPLPAPSAFRPVHNTHSLESRQRQKDTSTEWHLRRKSYGFEKMSPPEDKSIFRVDASTDSGLGRSGEQLGNWSPTERERERTAAAAAAHLNNGGGTIIHFGRVAKPPASPVNEGELSKRHSIAVEETWRDIRKTSQVHVNGGTVTSSSSSSTTNTSSQLQRNSAQKRVEFCKTEVHFAAESGRVNIVETDGKPPPTNNFRRRRRSTASGPLQSLVKSASVGGSTTASSGSNSNDNVTHFGDDPQRRKTIATSTVAYRATLMDPPEVVSQPTATLTSTSTSTAAAQTLSQVTVTLEPRYSLTESTSRNSYTSTSGVDTTDNETDELSNIRGILKNKPVKPKPYHLGENIESADVLWSVPAMKGERESPSGRDSGITSDSPISAKSVAERIRIVEQRQQVQKQTSPAGNGYSTKINVSLGAEEWPETGTHHYHHYRRASAQELLLEDLRNHQRILDEGLKSTSLIMKTMRSANEFDEAMRRLSIASIESALIQPTIVVPTPMLRSHSYQEETSSSRRTSSTSITSSDLFGSALYDSLPRTPLAPLAPLAPPRLKLLGNTQIPVSQQLTQLRRLYDAAEQDAEEDSADEEVKRYFRDNNNSDSGGGTQASSSPETVHHHPQPLPQADVFKGSEYSSSWSRLKAKRTIWKIEAQDQMLQRADLPKSNVMNIALHSPRVEKPKATPPTLRIGQLIPVAKPRTLFIQPTSVEAPDDSGSESLKIVKEARGARKLREHELSYFGVQQQQQQQQQTKLSTTSTNPRRTLPSRSKLSHTEEAVAPTTTTTKWQLLNDRPDLLRHSPQDNDYDDDEDDADNEEHCYENIANELTTTFRVKSPPHSHSPSSRSRSPGSYERKTDLQRDAQILSEMTRNADQTLKSLSDEAAIKDQRRRSCSLQRRSGKPLETIDEKVYNGERQSLSVARGTFASEARRNSRQSTPSPTPTRARSSSQSSIECCPRDRSRSSSRESNTQGAGSSDDQASKHRAERLRMRTPKREKSRHEPVEQRTSRHSSKPRSSTAHAAAAAAAATSSLESKRSSHHSRHRDVEHVSSESKHSSGSRLLRSSRVSDESRPRQSALRERERSRGSEKHREELTRSRGHSSRSRHSSEQAAQAAAGTRESSRPSKTRSSRSSHEAAAAAATTHKKSTTATAKSSKSTTHKATTTNTSNSNSNTINTTAITPSTHNELTHGKGTLNGHHHHQHSSSSSSSKHHGSGTGHGHREQPHHVHSLTTTTIAASRHQRDRHGKDRK